MTLARQAPTLAIFVGGCLSGAALLSLASPGAAPVPQVPARAVESAVEATESEAAGPEAAATDPPNPAAQPGEMPSTPEADAGQLEATLDTVGDAEGQSAAEVLARLEAAYQAQTLLQGHGDPNQGVRAAVDTEAPTPASTLAPSPSTVNEQTEPLHEPPTTASAVASLDEADDSADVSPGTDAASDERHAANVQHGDAQHGDVHHGSVHEGDVNQVQQLTLLSLQQVIVLPPNSPQQAQPAPGRGVSVAVTGSLGSSRINPWARVELSPSQDPWTTTRMSPRHDPWRSNRTVPGNPWGPTFGRRP
jgi:hypothetical protein